MTGFHKHLLAMYILFIGGCLVYIKTPPHPLTNYALKSARQMGFDFNFTKYYPMPCLRRYAIFEIHLRAVTTDPHFPSYNYIAVSEQEEPILLEKVTDLNRLLKMDSVIVDSDSTAWSIAMLLFNMNNRAYALSKKYIISSADNVPGHLAKLKKKNIRESENLRHRAKVSFVRVKNSDTLYINREAYNFIITMIDIHDKIYFRKSFNINDSIHNPMVRHKDNCFQVTFYTWEEGEGTIKKWQILINPEEYIIGYSYNTIAMYVGNWSSVGTFYFEYFNYEWSECTRSKH